MNIELRAIYVPSTRVIVIEALVRDEIDSMKRTRLLHLFKHPKGTPMSFEEIKKEYGWTEGIDFLELYNSTQSEVTKEVEAEKIEENLLKTELIVYHAAQYAIRMGELIEKHKQI